MLCHTYTHLQMEDFMGREVKRVAMDFSYLYGGCPTSLRYEINKYYSILNIGCVDCGGR